MLSRTLPWCDPIEVKPYGTMRSRLLYTLMMRNTQAYAARGVLGWQADPTDLRFRRVWQGILLIGVAVSASGYSPVLIIQFAQLTNGILLPLVAIFLLVIMNQQSLLKEHTNTTVQNGFGVMIVLVTLLLGFRSLNAVLNFL